MQSKILIFKKSIICKNLINKLNFLIKIIRKILKLNYKKLTAFTDSEWNENY